jgi:RNA polymerase sigma-70 factor (ECF subfamily)
MRAEPSTDLAFAEFVDAKEADIRRALTGRFGAEMGREAAAHALLYGLENWNRVSAMDNPAGYLFRVGQRWGRRSRRKRVHFDVVESPTGPWFEPGLGTALAALPAKQRVAVVLRHGSDMTYRQIAGLTNQSEASVRKQVERALASLRVALKVDVDLDVEVDHG